jgi:hypothetical protein
MGKAGFGYIEHIGFDHLHYLRKFMS